MESETLEAALFQWERSSKSQVIGFTIRGLGWMQLLPKFLPFHNSKNVPFEPVKTQTICWLSGRILSPKPLFALAAMTQGEEFEQCPCIRDSFPPSESHLQTDKTALKSGLVLRLWLQVSQRPADTLHTALPMRRLHAVIHKQTVHMLAEVKQKQSQSNETLHYQHFLTIYS